MTQSRLGKIIKTTFIGTYFHGTSFDPILAEFNGDPILEKFNGDSSIEPGILKKNYSENNNILIAVFFGLPVQKYSRELENNTIDSEFSAVDIAKNMLGIQFPRTYETDSPLLKFGKKLFILVKAPVVLAYNLLNSTFKFALNVCKLITEFLPNLLTNYFITKSYSIDEKNKKAKTFFLVLGYACKLLASIGRAITSPINGLRKIYYDNAVKPYINKDPSESEKLRSNKKLRSKILAGVLIGASIGVTVIVWAVLFPIAAKFIGNYLFQKIPSVVLNVVNAISPAVQAISTAVNAMTPIVGLFTLGSVTLGLGLAVNRIFFNIRNRIYAPKKTEGKTVENYDVSTNNSTNIKIEPKNIPSHTNESGNRITIQSGSPSTSGMFSTTITETNSDHRTNSYNPVH